MNYFTKELWDKVYGSKKMNVIEVKFRLMKICIFIGGLLIAITVLQYLLYKVARLDKCE